MAREKKPATQTRGQTTFKISTASRSAFAEPLAAFVFDREGILLESGKVKEGKLSLGLSAKAAARSQFFLLPATEGLAEDAITPARLRKLGAFQPIFGPSEAGEIPRVIEIPGSVLDLWPFCLCLVRGRVVRSSDGRPVCNARVHICEVDRLPWLIAKLPDPDIFRLRDDLLDALRRPPQPFPPDPFPDPLGPIPNPPEPRPGPDPAPFFRPLIRLGEHLAVPRSAGSAAFRTLPISDPSLTREVSAQLTSSSPALVRNALAVNWKLILPYLCLWPWWWRLRCDEVAVVATDPNGRFQAIVPYPCSGDHPDLYFWVEHDLGAGFETVHRPPMACWTHWNHPCGTEVTLHVTDPRVPSCQGEGSPPGKEVWVLSVGRAVSIGEIHTSLAGSLEGMVGDPSPGGGQNLAFGGKLEPRVWFGREALIEDDITHYLWSVRPAGGSESDWSPLNRQVIRHYTTGGGTAPVEVMGPEPGGSNIGRFRIRPMDPPPGSFEWLVADEREDLATAHFETQTPPAPNPFPACGVPDPHAGKYELKLELFDSSGTPVIWEDRGIVLRIATSEAPFGDDPINTEVAGSYHRIKNAGGKTTAFRMVLHIDNGRCGASIDAIAGAGIAVNPDCGVVTLVGPASSLDVGFHAGRPGGLARFDFDTERGLSTGIPQASANGGVDDGSANGFTPTTPCHFSKAGIPTSSFLDTCSQAAFSEHLRVWALTHDGYHRRSGLDAHDVAAFMLTEPCPPCPPCDQADGDQGRGPGQGRGQGRGQGQGGGTG